MSRTSHSLAVVEPPQPTVRNTVTVLLFALAAELFECDRIEVEISTGSTVGDIERHLRAMPLGARLPAGSRIAVNQRFAAPDDAVLPGDEVAVIPPVAGG